MAYSINDIRANLRLGGARPTLFQVELTSPFDPELNQIAPFMIQASSMPGSSIAPIEVPYFGRKVRVAGDRTFEPWSVQVMNDEDFKVRHAIETWHNRINSLSGNLNTSSIQKLVVRQLESMSSSVCSQQKSPRSMLTGTIQIQLKHSRLHGYMIIMK